MLISPPLPLSLSVPLSVYRLCVRALSLSVCLSVCLSFACVPSVMLRVALVLRRSPAVRLSRRPLLPAFPRLFSTSASALQPEKKERLRVYTRTGDGGMQSAGTYLGT